MRPATPPLVGAIVALMGLAVIPALAPAQYFGQNQVEYQTFKFRVLKTEHFDIYYYPRGVSLWSRVIVSHARFWPLPVSGGWRRRPGRGGALERSPAADRVR